MILRTTRVEGSREFYEANQDNTTEDYTYRVLSVMLEHVSQSHLMIYIFTAHRSARPHPSPTHPVGLQYNATKDGVFLIQSAIAQWIARWAFNPNAECSIPSSHTQSQ